ncbi:helix-turn-helix domain-containing protein [Streptomyces mirabilis]|uniref:helix-turn-helix domain-containing protein n=1 Tax=Streptomyces mirabilis TaxID=68239 RepID=UPI00363681A3
MLGHARPAPSTAPTGAGGLPALADRKRAGRPASFTALQVAEVKVLAHQFPAKTSTPQSRWSCPELVRTGRPDQLRVELPFHLPSPWSP